LITNSYLSDELKELYRTMYHTRRNTYLKTWMDYLDLANIYKSCDSYEMLIILLCFSV
jgi:hypothetical protein